MSSVSTPSASRGTVPDRLLVVMQKVENLEQVIDGVKHFDKAKPSFFTDADGATETAIEWGTSQRLTGRQTEQVWGGKKYMAPEYESIPPKTVTIPNKPFTDIRLWTIDTRAEGGRAYKFIDAKGRMFDMREDTFLEAVFNGEVESNDAGVFLTGQYIWVRAHSQMRVARVGSEMHKGLLEAKRRKNLPKITGKMQVLGGVYKTKADELYVYVGRLRGKGKDKKLCWLYVQLREPYAYRKREEKLVERWKAMTIQEKFDHERTSRSSSGCAEWRTTAMAVVEHLGTIDMGKDTAETLMWFPTTVIDGKVVKV